jgi:hypothetical protein
MSNLEDKFYKIQNILANQVDKANLLLEQLEAESKNLSEDQQFIFKQRLSILDNLINIIVYYDGVANEYVRYHPGAYNIQKLNEQLKIAQKYVNRLGGDWSVVTWGKLSDY